jgi:hypothetical protein
MSTSIKFIFFTLKSIYRVQCNTVRIYIRLLDFFFLALPAYFTFFYESSFSHACPIDRCSSTRLEPFIVRIKCTQAPRRRAVENSTRTQNEEVDPDSWRLTTTRLLLHACYPTLEFSIQRHLAPHAFARPLALDRTFYIRVSVDDDT